MRLALFSQFLCLVFVNINAQNAAYWIKDGQDTLNKAMKIKYNFNHAKNVIIFIGDGMSGATVSAARVLKGQRNGTLGDQLFLTMETFPHIALSKTYSTDRSVSDSSSTATAIFSGIKTNYGTVGVDSRVIRGDCMSGRGADVTSIHRKFLQEGRKAGIVTTARITHATPASAYAHSVDRNFECDTDTPKGCKDIASQLVDNNHDFHVIMGGGRTKFYNVTGSPVGIKGERTDGRNLVEDWKKSQATLKRDFSVLLNSTDLKNLDTSKGQAVLGLFSDSHLPYNIDIEEKRTEGPTIVEMTRAAIELLSKNNDKGFVLLIEGGRIDHAHHDSLAQRALLETIAMNEAVEVAKSLVNLDETLMIVTADHSHVFSVGGYISRNASILGATDTEVDAFGKSYTAILYANGPGAIDGKTRGNVSSNVESVDNIYESTVKLDYETHGQDDVNIYATGPMAHLFHGTHEESYIAHVMMYASCVGVNKKHCTGDKEQYKSICDAFKGTGNSLTQSINYLLVLSIAVASLSYCFT